MARQEITQYFDDLDATPLSEGQVKIIRFSFDGTDYVLDLSEDNARAFYETLDPFLKVARKDTKDVLKKVNPADVREWAQSKGMEVANRGKIPQEVMRAYRDAHS